VQETTKPAIDDAISGGRAAEALADMRLLYSQSPTLANAQFVLSRLPRVSKLTRRVSARVAFLRSFTIEPVIPHLRASAGLHGVDLEIKVGDFNTYVRDMLSPASFLTEFESEIVVVAAQTRDVIPELWPESGSIRDAEMDRAAEERFEQLRAGILEVRAHGSAAVIVHNLEMPDRPAAGILDAQSPQGESALIRRFNERLAALAAETRGVYVLDYDALVARHGRLRWHDEQKWLTARMPIAADCLPVLAEEYVRFVLPLTGKTCKALVCDLDNTLWGGVIGEDGMAGIRLDSEFPGAAFRAVQRAVIDLRDRGIILAVASKNNEADALAAIDGHPGMLLKSADFAALRINWNDKARNLTEIAEELNIGIDSIAFLDDNPVERRRVRVAIPEACVIELPPDPIGYAAALRSCPAFERLTLTKDDKERGRYYAGQRRRGELARAAASLEDFYRSLEQVVEIARVTTETLARAAQLTQKTNQFNLTTRRYSEQELAGLMAESSCDVLCARVRDRYGDNGIVAIAILRMGSDRACEIDTFLMSCRVIGRTVESALIASILDYARAKGAAGVRGWFCPTAKNAPAKSFYADHCFVVCECEPEVKPAENAVCWRFDLARELPRAPEWITLERSGLGPD
jgi:FkbH-like protein